ncbi:Sterol desaturase/sphingolipid hydroxylase, fatty acid hydroxylase superfamily [Pararobbsia alpina]|uniref:sterol desaturase family protein n=1 Tax=Pararobbsia alpina TaxID=621374 RepID=UPI0039A606AB
MFASGLAASFADHLQSWLSTYAVVIVMLTVGALVERTHRLDANPSRQATRWGLAYSVAASVVDHVVRPLTTVIAMAIVQTCGGGLIELPSHGAWAVLSVVVMFVTIDLLEYAYHRLQHTVPFLWRLHSLHHSASTFNVTVTLRHHWLDAVIKVCCLYPVAAILFKVDLWILGVVGLPFLLVNYFAHLNLRVELGRFGAWVNSPQYHRLHHARDAAYFDKNFTQFLPLWDWLGGTMRLPEANEWPVTGLDDGREPATVLDALVWPLRSQRNTNARGGTSSDGIVNAAMSADAELGRAP